MAEFLSNRKQVVYAGKTESDNTALQFGVPQGSVLGPRVFVQYAEDVADILQRRPKVDRTYFAVPLSRPRHCNEGVLYSLWSRLYTDCLLYTSPSPRDS